MTSMQRWAAPAALALLALACKASENPSLCIVVAASYDQSCTVDGDCAAVIELYQCGGCPCRSGAINRQDLARYQNDLTFAVSSTAACECPAEGPAPQCCGGVCSNSPECMPRLDGGPADARDASEEAPSADGAVVDALSE
jgi:hypothetical protein